MSRAATRICLFLAAFASATAARASEESFRAAGGAPEELRAVLELDAPQFGRLQTILRDGDNDLQRLRDNARSRGAAVPIDQLLQWQDQLREKIKDVLHPNQLPNYESWVEKKRRLSEEYDKALFGLPTCTELKVKKQLSVETLEKMQKVTDQAVTDIRGKIAEMRGAGATVAAIGDAVNDLRKDAIRQMGGMGSSEEKRKFNDWLNTWVKLPAEKLSRPEGDRLDRTMKALELADGVTSDRVQSLVAAILWHLEENSGLRRGLGKELVLSLVQKRPEVDMWAAIYEYGALIDIHDRRVKALRDDLKAMLPTKQIAKLVAEGVLE